MWPTFERGPSNTQYVRAAQDSRDPHVDDGNDDEQGAGAGTECKLCSKKLARAGDMNRHMRAHARMRQPQYVFCPVPALARQITFGRIHRCPFPGCSFQNNQRTNVETHIRTQSVTTNYRHRRKSNCLFCSFSTGERSQHCPDCDFRTSDPGSLTRHRKRLHKYVPKPRRRRANMPAPLVPDSALTLAQEEEEEEEHSDYRERGSPPYYSESASSSSRCSSAVPTSPWTRSPREEPHPLPSRRLTLFDLLNPSERS